MMSAKEKDEKANEKVIEMESILNKLEGEVIKPQESVNMPTIAYLVGKLQGVYKELVFFKEPYNEDK